MTPHQTPPSVTDEMVERVAKAIVTRSAVCGPDPCTTMDARSCGCFRDAVNDIAALSAAEATSAPPPVPVSGEREELAKILDDVIAHPHREARRKMWNALPRIATALRTPHGLPGEEDTTQLLAYKAKRDGESHAAMAELAKQAQELDMGYK
jgi:hypothetical protein